MRRGFALIYQLLVTVVVAMLVGAILLHSRAQIFSAFADQESLRAQYAAESGVAAAIASLSAQRTWQTGFSNEPMPNGRGDYSVRFASGGGQPGCRRQHQQPQFGYARR